MVLAGAGPRAFCSGQDLDEAAAVTWQQIVPWLNRQRAMYQAVRDLDKPCVAAVHGVAAGAGFQMALCADWRITTADSRWGQPEVKAGLASIVGSYLMTLHVGHTHNIQMSLSGDLVSGQRAYEIGLVTELCAADELMGSALARARKLAALPPTAVRLVEAAPARDEPAGLRRCLRGWHPRPARMLCGRRTPARDGSLPGKARKQGETAVSRLHSITSMARGWRRLPPARPGSTTRQPAHRWLQ
ncbi:enoyl-CoA hydratase/isomerase family protein [Cupriavidus basilensis]